MVAAMTLSFHDSKTLRDNADQLAYARQIVRAEALALQQVADRLNDTFLKTIELFYHCVGRIAITGTGKSALIDLTRARLGASWQVRYVALSACRHHAAVFASRGCHSSSSTTT